MGAASVKHNIASSACTPAGVVCRSQSTPEAPARAGIQSGMEAPNKRRLRLQRWALGPTREVEAKQNEIGRKQASSRQTSSLTMSATKRISSICSSESIASVLSLGAGYGAKRACRTRSRRVVRTPMINCDGDPGRMSSRAPVRKNLRSYAIRQCEREHRRVSGGQARSGSSPCLQQAIDGVRPHTLYLNSNSLTSHHHKLGLYLHARWLHATHKTKGGAWAQQREVVMRRN